jgi:hypothetical protein
MLQHGARAIVNVASVAGVAGIGDRAAYNASNLDCRPLLDIQLRPDSSGMELRVDGGWMADGSWDTLRLKHRNAPMNSRNQMSFN